MGPSRFSLRTMSNTDHTQDVEQKADKIVQFRDDLREPNVSFGRCSVTGEFGKVVNIDLGDISIEAPNVDKGVVYDPETKEVIFTCWRPCVFDTNLSVSESGLEMLLAFIRSQEAPVPSLTPHLVYMWQVLYTDGSLQGQYEMDPITQEEKEFHSGSIDFSRILQIGIVPRQRNPEQELPTATLVVDGFKFFLRGQEIDVDYDNLPSVPEDARPFYARKVTHTWGSVMGPQLTRNIQEAHTTILQLLGWQTPDEQHRCIISIDERGNWRPWSYM